MCCQFVLRTYSVSIYYLWEGFQLELSVQMEPRGCSGSDPTTASPVFVKLTLSTPQPKSPPTTSNTDTYCYRNYHQHLSNSVKIYWQVWRTLSQQLPAHHQPPPIILWLQLDQQVSKSCDSGQEVYRTVWRFFFCKTTKIYRTYDSLKMTKKIFARIPPIHHYLS